MSTTAPLSIAAMNAARLNQCTSATSLQGQSDTGVATLTVAQIKTKRLTKKQ